MLFVIACVVYVPALQNDFVNFDDNEYVYENGFISTLNLRALRWMFTEYHSGNWHPLTWLSHAADYFFWGLNPFGHHLTSIMLHGLNTLLVFFVVMQLMLRTHRSFAGPVELLTSLSPTVQSLIAAGVTALLFGVHPLHVESVAWAAERKDVLCAWFFLLTLSSYLFYTAAVDTKKRKRWFVACALLAAAALMAKPMAVTLPLVLLLLDIYPLKRIVFSAGAERNIRVLLEKVPFCLMSALSIILTVTAQHEVMAFKSLESLPLRLRLLNAFHSYLFYLVKLLFPVRLVPYYPFPDVLNGADLARYGLSAFLFVVITSVCIWLWKRGRRFYCAAWAYYLMMLLPVIGIVQVGSQAAADRYTYLPSISIFLVAAAGIARLYAVFGRSKNMLMCWGLAAALVFFALAGLTMRQISIWRDSETLWKHVIESFPGRVHFAHNNLGVAYLAKGLQDKAFEEYQKAIAIRPMYAEAHTNVGNVYMKRGEYDKAVEEYKKAIVANPRLVAAYYNLGNGYYAQGIFDEAIAQYKKVLSINPNHAETHNNLGNAYYKLSNYVDAADHFEKALALGFKVNADLLEFVKHNRPYL